ncbi:type II and III secretion system protein family protein [Gallibacterium genomosp. 3]|uniref:Secretin n=1 Tax=Gallibacterium genomosp. 3 TaxID=505345 RepID=A0A1A7QEA3_9PAST|nr:type II and III secretion system protein family protein [Gallibacterium genomosp. 3]OBX11790.1 secretin [Gallibacterium genomosp. 3]
MSLKKLVLTALCIFISVATNAKTYNLEEGQSKVIKSTKKIDTVFVSLPDVADYEILDDNSFIIYAKKEGYSEVTAFDKEGNEIVSDSINVNAVFKGIDYANEQLKLAFPKSNLSVKKMGKAYVIEGKAKSELEQQEVKRIVGEALGAKREQTTKTIDKYELPFLTNYDYSGVVDTSTLDNPTQINVKLSVVEVSKTLSEQLGINWSNLPNSVLDATTGAITKIYSSNRNAIGFNNANGGLINFSVDRINGFVKALDNTDKAKILAEPNISILSGELGEIFIGGELPFAQRTDGSTNVIYKDFGIKLGVGAKLLKDERIRLFLSQEVSTVASATTFSSDGFNVPVFSIRRSNSTFEIEDGASFVIGGLYSENDTSGISKIPVLGDVPVLGAFFRSVSKGNDKKELVVVATVNVMKKAKSDNIIDYPDYQSKGLLEDFFAAPNLYHRSLVTNFFKHAGFSE